ncbi:MAG: glycosyltransferase family 2 protein [Candidatus Korarchaeum sp.]
MIIVTFNSSSYIGRAIESVLLNDPLEVIVVDNSSTDGTPELIAREFPEVRIVRMRRNVGFGAANNAGVRLARGNFVAFLNPDAYVEKNWLMELLRPLGGMDRTITVPKVLTYDGSKIDVCGLSLHFTGLAFMRGLGEEPHAYEKPEFVSGIPGCSFAMRKEDYLSLGGFDESFFLYHEDVELSWRALQRGFKILYVPTSVVYHRYEERYPAERIYHMERGRYVLLRKYYRRRDLLVGLPSLMLTELVTLRHFSRWGREGLKYKVKGLKDGIAVTVNTERKLKIPIQHLDWRVPTDRPGINPFERIARKVANTLYHINFKILKLLNEK